MSAKTDKLHAASLWMAAMSKPAATQFKALAAVLADDIAISSRSGKDEVLEWLGSWPGKSLIRTGTWLEPAVDGDEVHVKCMFDKKAAYYAGELTLSVDGDGIIRKASMLVLPAPQPLGGAIQRVWGPRRAVERLPDHLADAHGITARKTTQLDNGVFKVETKDDGPLVVRVFPADRPVAEVKGDAAVLGFLEQREFPAERCVAPVSTFEGQGVLVTGFVPGKQPTATLRNASAMAGLLGRLHALKGAPKAVKREAGGLHLYSAGTSIRSEIDTAIRSLEAGAFRGTDKRYDALMVALHEADDFAGLPVALSHPDFHFKNMVATKDDLVPIDWAGAGTAPRVLALGFLLFYGSLVQTGWDPKRVGAIVASYLEHVPITDDEVDHLAGAMLHRMLIHEVYGWCVGMASQRKPGPAKEWPTNAPMCEAIAERVRGLIQRR